MSPMPREPPVTRATLPSMEKRFDIGGTMPRRRAEGKGRSPGEALPEVQEALRAFMARHWEAWLDTKLPALRFEIARGREDARRARAVGGPLRRLRLAR